jgi:hypothetical protein
MERTEVLDMMSGLKLYGMRSASEETLAAAIKRKHEPQRFVGDLLKAEISEKQARSIKYQLTVARLPLAKERLTPSNGDYEWVYGAILQIQGAHAFIKYPKKDIGLGATHGSAGRPSPIRRAAARPFRWHRGGSGKILTHVVS